MARREELTDEQWAIIAPLITEPPRREDGRGSPCNDSREVINGILGVLRSAARWEDMPDRFPPYQTCHRRFQQWVREGVYVACWRHSPKTFERVATSTSVNALSTGCS